MTTGIGLTPNRLALAFARILLETVITVLAAATITFAIIQAAPGEPFSTAGEGTSISPDARENLRRQFGLDRPVAVQYARYIQNIVTGQFGTSFRERRPVTEVISSRLPATITLGMAALVLGFAGGIALSLVQVRRRNGPLDRTLTAATLAIYSSPLFWTGLVLSFVLAVKAGLFPGGGIVSFRIYSELSPIARLADRLWHLVLPATTLGLALMAVVARFHRSALIDALQQPFIVAARVRGNPESRLRRRHAFKKSLVPITTLIGLALPLIVSGAVLVEQVFAWPGIGKLLVDSVLARDYPVSIAVVMLGTVAVVVGNRLADLLQAAVDPRTRQ